MFTLIAKLLDRRSRKDDFIAVPKHFPALIRVTVLQQQGFMQLLQMPEVDKLKYFSFAPLCVLSLFSSA